jgi:hypothetical protein
MALGVLMDIGYQPAKVPFIGDGSALERMLEKATRSVVCPVNGFRICVKEIGKMPAGSMMKALPVRRVYPIGLGDLGLRFYSYKEMEMISQQAVCPCLRDRRNISYI